MKRNFITVLVFLLHSFQQFGMLRHAATALQRTNFAGKNSVFTDEFLSVTSYFKDSISDVRLFSQVPLDRGLENKIFQLAVEDEIPVKTLLSTLCVRQQTEMIIDMELDQIAVGIVPDEYRFINWQERYAKNGALSGFKITNNKGIPSAMIAALISYHSGKNVILLGKPRETLCIHDHKDFTVWQQKFDHILSRFQ